jgi:hypothetical protein
MVMELKGSSDDTLIIMKAAPAMFSEYPPTLTTLLPIL